MIMKEKPEKETQEETKSQAEVLSNSIQKYCKSRTRVIMSDKLSKQTAIGVFFISYWRATM